GREGREPRPPPRPVQHVVLRGERLVGDLELGLREGPQPGVPPQERREAHGPEALPSPDLLEQPERPVRVGIEARLQQFPLGIDRPGRERKRSRRKLALDGPAE
ncbi:MAG: hypothetical protein ACK56I_03770, partial [bacterium]